MINEITKRTLSTIVLLPLAFFIIYDGSIAFILFLISLFLISIFEWFKMSKKKKYLFPGILFIILSFYSVYLLRIDPIYQNYFFFLFSIIISVSTDIGGFIFGKLFNGARDFIISIYLVGSSNIFFVICVILRKNNGCRRRFFKG